MEPTVLGDSVREEDRGEPMSSPSSPSYSPPSSSSSQIPKSLRKLAPRPQTPTTMKDLMLIDLEDEDVSTGSHTPEKTLVLKSQREDNDDSPERHFDTQVPNPNQPGYYWDRPPFEGVVAWWCKSSGKGAIVERGDRKRRTLDTMVSVKLSDIKPSYGALCPGSYVTYQKWDRGLYDFWVVRGHAYVP